MERFLPVMSKTKPGERRGLFKRRSWSRNFWTRWLKRRLPPTDQVRLGRHNLFIFPVREGSLFLVLLVVMLLTGINYQNSLIYLLTFLLGALFYIGILQTHDNLSGIELSLADLEEGFAGSTLTVRLRLKVTDGSDRPAVSVSADDSTATLHLQSHIHDEAALSVTPTRRGLYPIPRLQVETRYPMGLFRAWSYLWLKTPLVVYPRLIKPPKLEASGHVEDEGRRAQANNSVSDEVSLRPYRAGDPLQRVQWKRYARDGQMVVLEREPVSAESRWLDYEDFPGTDPELRLSYLSWLVEDCYSRGQLFGLRLPGAALMPAGGESHRREALRCLALFGNTVP
jgi:uncharacterized protein (DUF58 family)